MTNRPRSARIARSVVVAVWLATTPFPSQAFAYAVRLGGELGYDLRVEDHDTMPRQVEHITTVRVDAAGYVHAPWLATYDGSLGLNTRDLNDGNGGADSDLVSGDLSLRLFPLSRFPLELFAERSDSAVDTDLIGFDVERTRYGVLQQFTTESGGAYRLRYERNDQTQDTHIADGTNDERRDIGDLFQASFDTSAGFHRLSFDSTLSQIDTVDSPNRTETRYGALRHSYRPSPRLSAEDLYSYHASKIALDDTQFDNDVLQLTSYAFWRPETERPVRVSSTFRALTRTSGNAPRSNAGNSTLGATWEWDRNWQLSANGGVSTVDVDDRIDTSTFQTSAARFTSDDRDLLGGTLTWLAEGDLGNVTDTDGATQNAGAQVGYAFSRNWQRARAGSVGFDLRQNLVERADTDQFAALTLLSTAALGYYHRGDAQTSIARLSLSDSRTEAHGGDTRQVQGDFQIANLQLSIDRRLSPTTSLIGNATLQATREYRPEDGFSSEGNGDWRPTATADLSFVARPLFGVPNLSFRSTLRFVSDAYIPVLDDPTLPEGRDDRRWENRLEYFVGRLQCRVIARLAEIDGEAQSLMLFQIRRYFGGL